MGKREDSQASLPEDQQLVVRAAKSADGWLKAKEMKDDVARQKFVFTPDSSKSPYQNAVELLVSLKEFQRDPDDVQSQKLNTPQAIYNMAIMEATREYLMERDKAVDVSQDERRALIDKIHSQVQSHINGRAIRNRGLVPTLPMPRVLLAGEVGVRPPTNLPPISMSREPLSPSGSPYPTLLPPGPEQEDGYWFQLGEQRVGPFAYALPFDKGLAYVVHKDTLRQTHILPSGKEVEWAKKFDAGVGMFASNGLAVAIQNGKSQYVNRSGINVFNKTFNSALDFPDDMAGLGVTAIVTEGTDGQVRQYHIDAQGEALYPNRFREVGRFHGSTTTARTTSGKFVYIDKNGEQVLQNKFPGELLSSTPFMPFVDGKEYALAKFDSSRTFILIDTNGKTFRTDVIAWAEHSGPRDYLSTRFYLTFTRNTSRKVQDSAGSFDSFAEMMAWLIETYAHIPNKKR